MSISGSLLFFTVSMAVLGGLGAFVGNRIKKNNPDRKRAVFMGVLAGLLLGLILNIILFVIIVFSAMANL